MLQLKQTNWNPEISSLLAKYPKWQQMLLSAIEKPKLDAGYCPFVIEIFDQHGLLAGRVNKFGCYECTRNSQDVSRFIAWMFDGELAIFYVDSHMLLNRIATQEELT
ncbi:hypothetical protein [Calothrix sp. CCY 0018]|uniref:hypothetical protein n=1 Tax=Calothrix sp. CCY 0018 TaxID=3103864 RepID=UPI0039C6157F